MSRAFLDTNILIYAYVGDSPKRAAAIERLAEGFTISVQSLNEFATVARRKFRWDWVQLETALADLRSLAHLIVANDLDIHRHGLELAERYGFSIYDAMIVSAALHARCDCIYSEDMHHGLVVGGRLQVINPFRAMTPPTSAPPPTP